MSRARDFSEDLSNRFSQVDVWAILLIALSLAISLLWIGYTDFTEDDAFITFRIAKQIAAGNGFVYNIGERIYGTTTPLLTILLALSIKFFSGNIISGARILDVLASSGTLFFTWRTLRFLQRTAAEQLFPLAAILLSSKLLYMNIAGMETPIVICLMAASWFACAQEKMKWSGFLCGLLLWTRADLIFWPLILVIMSATPKLKDAIHIALFTGITYLPWVIFAILYFGSPIPQTVTAKWVAYSQFNHSPFTAHLSTILNYLSPFEITGSMRFLGPLMILSVIAWAIWRGQIVREKMFVLLFAFIIVEITRLTLTRATFFNRYFIPVLWATLVLFGVSLGMLWDTLRTTRMASYTFNASLVLALLVTIGLGVSLAGYVKVKQTYRFENSLKEIGIWLRDNSEPQSTVLLEPLGYVGYYSERTMIDEVGLVTPAVVKLKLQHIGADQYPSIFHPTYIILHCDDASRLQSRPEVGLAQNYTLIKEYNPLAFDPKIPKPPSDFNNLVRSSCYQIWQRSN